MTSLTFYGGVGEIGGNKILVDLEGSTVFLDFGISYQKAGDFYEEFLQPRSTRGIHDYLTLGLIPPLDIYDSDLITSDIKIPLRPTSVDAVFLTHGHLDHAGSVGLLKREIPVVSSHMTAAILKAMRDTGRTKIEAEIPYSTPRRANDEDNRIIETLHWKNNPFRGRDLYLTEAPSEELRSFLRSCPSGRKLTPGKLAHASDAGLDFEFRSYPVDHSIYGATAYALNTPSGWIVYTGDLRMHGKHQEKTEQFLEEASKLDPNALIIEGTRTSRNEDMEESEELVKKTCLEATDAEDGLVVADFAPRNCERLHIFSEIAMECGRELVVLAKDAYLLDAAGCVDSHCKMTDQLVYEELKSESEGWETEVLAKYRDRLMDPSDISKRPEKYILCLSFWDVKHLLDIKPEKGTYIYSSSEAYTEEQAIDFIRLSKWLSFFGMKAKGFEIKEVDRRATPVFQHGYHASGHASGSELIKIAKEINPEVVIPIHTENAGFFVNNLKEYEVIVPKEGEPIEL